MCQVTHTSAGVDAYNLPAKWVIFKTGVIELDYGANNSRRLVGGVCVAVAGFRGTSAPPDVALLYVRVVFICLCVCMCECARVCAYACVCVFV